MKRLHTKFLVFILLPVIGILIVSAALSFLIARHVVVKELWFIGSLSIRQAVDEIDLGITTGVQTLRVMALQEEWLNLDQPGLFPFLRRLPKEFPIEEAFFAFPDGRYIVGVAEEKLPQGYDHRLAEWYEKAVNSDLPIVSAPYVSPFSSNMIMTVACKVVTRDGSLKGVLGYNVPLTTLRRKMSSMVGLEDFPGAIFSVVLRDGRYLMHSNEAKIGHKMGESGEDLPVRMRQAMSEGVESWQGVGTVEGDSWFGGLQKSRQGDIYVALEIPLASAVMPTLWKLGLAYMVLGLTSVLLLSVILVKMALMIARPLRMLSAAAVRMRSGDYAETLPVISKDELGQLVHAFNTMAEGLRQRDYIRDTFGRYVTQEVVDQLLESEQGLKLGGENREMTMIMSDLRGFTALTADMQPEKVITFLNRYLEAMVDILLRHRAVIDEIEGDGILAFFGAPTPMADHAMRAVACALEMQREMENVNARNKTDGLPRLEMAVAVNTGSVVVGNIGSEKRTKYGVVGSEVNFMGRIESFAVGGEILISHATFERVRDAVTVDSVIHVEMKGIPELVKLYSVRAIGEPFNVELKETVYEPEPIEQKIPLRLSRVDDNIVTPVSGIAWLTHLSETAAILFTTEELVQREEIRIDVLDATCVKTLGEGFAKILSVRDRDAGIEAVVRFTFISPGLRRLFRRAFVRGAAEKA